MREAAKPSRREKEAMMTDPDDAQEHITAFWDTVAPGYEAHDGNIAEYGSAGYARWVDALAGVLPESPADVLDVAAGSGYLALAAASLGHRVTALDLSPAMLDVLVSHATARQLPVEVCLGDAVAPDFPPAGFDVVTSRHFLWTLRDPATALSNWRELLRPGGRLVALDGFWFSGESTDDAPTLFAEHYTAATRAALPFIGLGGPEPILAALSAAGFADPVAEPRPDLALGGTAPYLITAVRL